MGSGARLENDLGGCELGKEWLDLRAPDLATQYRPFLFVNGVDRENMLGRVDRNALVFRQAALSLGWWSDPQDSPHSYIVPKVPLKTEC
jgi:hypothetical protein